MAGSVNPGGGIRDADPYLTAGAIRYGGGDWIVPSTETYYAAHEGLGGLPLDAFDATYSGDSLDVEIATGEAFVAGSWLGTNSTHTVTLTAQTDGQTVYIGWKKGTANSVVVGLDGAFESEWPRLAVWEFDADGSGVTGTTDQRPVGEQIDVRNEGSAVVADSANAVAGSDVAGQVADAAHADAADDATDADDSARLGGHPPTDYLRSDEGDSFADGDVGVAYAVSDGQLEITPIAGGTQQAGKQIVFDPATGQWDIEGTPQADGSDIDTEAKTVIKEEYQTLGDVPTNMEKGRTVYVVDDETLYREDGT